MASLNVLTQDIEALSNLAVNLPHLLVQDQNEDGDSKPETSLLRLALENGAEQMVDFMISSLNSSEKSRKWILWKDHDGISLDLAVMNSPVPNYQIVGWLRQLNTLGLPLTEDLGFDVLVRLANKNCDSDAGKEILHLILTKLEDIQGIASRLFLTGLINQVEVEDLMIFPEFLLEKFMEVRFGDGTEVIPFIEIWIEWNRLLITDSRGSKFEPLFQKLSEFKNLIEEEEWKKSWAPAILKELDSWIDDGGAEKVANWISTRYHDIFDDTWISEHNNSSKFLEIFWILGDRNVVDQMLSGMDNLSDFCQNRIVSVYFEGYLEKRKPIPNHEIEMWNWAKDKLKDMLIGMNSIFIEKHNSDLIYIRYLVELSMLKDEDDGKRLDDLMPSLKPNEEKKEDLLSICGETFDLSLISKVIRNLVRVYGGNQVFSGMDELVGSGFVFRNDFDSILSLVLDLVPDLNLFQPKEVLRGSGLRKEFWKTYWLHPSVIKRLSNTEDLVTMEDLSDIPSDSFVVLVSDTHCVAWDISSLTEYVIGTTQGRNVYDVACGDLAGSVIWSEMDLKLLSDHPGAKRLLTFLESQKEISGISQETISELNRCLSVLNRDGDGFKEAFHERYPDKSISEWESLNKSKEIDIDVLYGDAVMKLLTYLKGIPSSEEKLLSKLNKDLSVAIVQSVVDGSECKAFLRRSLETGLLKWKDQPELPVNSKDKEWIGCPSCLSESLIKGNRYEPDEIEFAMCANCRYFWVVNSNREVSEEDISKWTQELTEMWKKIVGVSDSSKEMVDSDSSKEMVDSDSSEEMVDSDSSEEMVDSDSSEEMVDSDSSEEMADSSDSFDCFDNL